jgi:hypothetical protein
MQKAEIKKQNPQTTFKYRDSRQRKRKKKAAKTLAAASASWPLH